MNQLDLVGIFLGVLQVLQRAFHLDGRDHHPRVVRVGAYLPVEVAAIHRLDSDVQEIAVTLPVREVDLVPTGTVSEESIGVSAL